MGIHSSSRAAGRGSVAPAVAAPEAPGSAAACPSFSRAAADSAFGAIADSPMSKRSTANRIGAFGSIGAATAPALADGLVVALARGDGVAGVPALADAPGDALLPAGRIAVAD